MDRRGFFKLAAFGAASCAGAGLLASCTDPTEPVADEAARPAEGHAGISFTEHTDVLIVGSGMAGLSAAIAPSEQKLSVMVVDKASLLGGESYDAVGITRVQDSLFQKAAGITTLPQPTWDRYRARLKEQGVDDNRLNAVGKVYNARADWLDHITTKYGAQFADPRSYIDTGSDADILIPLSGLGDMESVMRPLRDRLSEQGVVYRLNSVAKSFIVDENNHVAGMRIFDSKMKSTVDISAEQVIIAAGGYTANQYLFNDHLRSYLDAGCITYLAAGEAHLMASTIDAQLADMDVADNLLGSVPQACAWGCFGPMVALNPRGQRFTREDGVFNCANTCWSDRSGYWWSIFDTQLTQGVQSNSLARTVQADEHPILGPFSTVEALADAIDVGSTMLQSTLQTYDKAVAAGVDAEFGKTAFLKSLTPPYYAVKLRPVRYRTLGGYCVNTDMQAIDSSGAAIEGVYAAGACAALRCNGLSDCGTSGWLAGTAAAQACTSRT